MGILRYKDGVTLRPDPAGARLLGSIERVTRTWPTDMTVTAGSDGHKPGDPHTLGRGFDVRTHGLDDHQKSAFLNLVLADLDDGALVEQKITGIWYAANTKIWFAQVENYNTDTEHLHFQLRNTAVFG